MDYQKIKILPILVIVAMLAFSVRLVDFATGVSTLTGSAFAEDGAPTEDSAQTPDDAALTEATEEPMAADADADAEKIAMSGTGEDAKESEAKEPEKADAAPAKEEDTKDENKPEIDWRDAGDEELGYSSVRMEMFDDLGKRGENLDQRERDLVTREALLKAAEQELDQKYNELSQLRNKIESLLGEQSEEEQARITSLVKVYEGMKPKDAARIFDTLDLDVLISVMSRMGERKLSPILANMNPERARTVTIMLAEEKQLPTLLPN